MGFSKTCPLGSTGCWKTAGREAGCRFLWRLLPLRFGRITPGPLLWPGRFCARCAKRCMHFCNIIRLRRLSFHGIMTLYRGGMSTPRASDRPVSLKKEEYQNPPDSRCGSVETCRNVVSPSMGDHEMHGADAPASESECMASVTLKGIKKVYPFSGDDNKKKKKTMDTDGQKKEKLQAKCNKKA